MGCMKKYFTINLAPREGTENAPPQPGATGGDPNQPKYLLQSDFDTKFNGVAGQVRKMNDAIENLSKGTGTLDALVAVGLLEKNPEGQYVPKAAAAAPPPPEKKKDEVNPDVARLSGEMAKLQKQIADKDAELTREREQAIMNKKSDAVKAALQKNDAINPSRDVRNFDLSKIVLGEDDSVSYVVKGEYGDENVPLDKYVGETFFKDNQELFRSRGTPGSGTPANRGGGGNRPANQIPFAQWQDMNWMAQNRQAVLDGKFTLEPEPSR